MTSVFDGVGSSAYGFDVERIRRDFPVLKREVNGHTLVYLDNAATSQRPVQVLAEITRFYRDSNANIHRGVHTLSVEATDQYEGVREKVRDFIGAPSASEIIFTRNTTESINLVAHSWARTFLDEGDEVVISEIEHHSNIVPWQMLRDERGIVLRHIPMLDDGTLDLDEARKLINPRTRLLAITLMSNALGSIVPVGELADLAHARGARVLVDAAQAAPHLPVDVGDLGADFLAFSAHKMLGPTGVGVLWARGELLEAMPPFLGGGDMIATVSLTESTWNEVPHKFEAGTPNVGGVVAFGTAIDYLQALGMDRVRAHERELTGYALGKLIDVPGVTLHGPLDPDLRGGVVSFSLEGVHPHDVGQVLDSRGVAIRAGHHCAQPVMIRLGIPATARASFYIYNTREEGRRARGRRPRDRELLRRRAERVGGLAMTSAALDDLYREILLDHYRSPRNRGRLDTPTASADGANPLCGDQITLDVVLDDDGNVVDVAFEGSGCSISQASSSMMTGYVKGRPAEEALAGVEAFQRMMVDGEPLDEEFGDIEALSGVRKFPVRVKCASLAWKTLEQALTAEESQADPVTTDERSMTT